MKNNNLFKNKIHFIGIGGIGMSGIAELMLDLGYKIQGSDINLNSNIERLKKRGIKFFKGHNKLNIKNVRFGKDLSPIDKNCQCSTCRNYSLAYLHHLFKSGELLGLNLITSHNIFFMNNLMSIIRDSIENDNLERAEKEWFI